MDKSPDAFRTIREVAEWLDTPAHVLRFWESKFKQVRPVKRAGGRRYYRPGDMMLLGGIKKLLHEDGMTIKGVQKMLGAEGVKSVSALSQSLDGDGEATGSAPALNTDAAPVAQIPTPPESPIEDAVIVTESATETSDAPKSPTAAQDSAPTAEAGSLGPLFGHRQTDDVSEPAAPAETASDATDGSSEPDSTRRAPIDVPNDPSDDAKFSELPPLTALLTTADSDRLATRRDRILPLYQRLVAMQTRLASDPRN